MTATGPATAVPGTPWSVSFSDGSGNGFVFRGTPDATTFNYLPVDPARSSSGTYSGGSPRSGALDDDGAQALWELVLRCRDAKSEHATTRSKGTGAFDLSAPGGNSSFLLALGSACLRDFGTFARSYRGAPAPAAATSQTFEGVARNAKSGALLITDDAEIWVDLPEWPDAAYGKRVKVTGHFGAREDLPVFVPEEGQPAVAGIPVPAGTDLKAAATRRVLMDIKWEVLE